ncbi:MAG: hypothetical protein HC802_11525 [Caldilineaceae bacterium]|nr:hypothetical protein [Caldilineaceae bacterium]
MKYMGSIRGTTGALAILIVLLSLLLPGVSTLAQAEGQVQKLTGRIEAGDVSLYLLSDLRAGQRLYVYVHGTSGNLDPLAGVVDGATDPLALVADFESALATAAANGDDVLIEVERLRDEYTLAWDDDGGGGLSVALELEIPADGDYHLLVGGALSSLGGGSFGDYEMLVGLDAPAVLTGEAEATGANIAVLDAEATPPRHGVQEIFGSFSDQKTSTFWN